MWRPSLLLLLLNSNVNAITVEYHPLPDGECFQFRVYADRNKAKDSSGHYTHDPARNHVLIIGDSVDRLIVNDYCIKMAVTGYLASPQSRLWMRQLNGLQG